VAEEEKETIQLGGSIGLSGFREIDGGSMIVVKKIVGSYVRKFSSRLGNFQGFNLNMKEVHSSNDTNPVFELHGHVVDNGKTYSAEVAERNLFVAVDSLMKKLENSIG
jgi:ribosome-associated translation inhibitor RaiA